VFHPTSVTYSNLIIDFKYISTIHIRAFSLKQAGYITYVVQEDATEKKDMKRNRKRAIKEERYVRRDRKERKVDGIAPLSVSLEIIYVVFILSLLEPG
jgi:hypothetical protein